MRRRMLIPVAAMAAVVATSPASAAPADTGWSCISPFANFTNSNYPDDPPALDHILNSLAIQVERTDATPLAAVAGRPLALNDLLLRLQFTDTRIAEQMYRRTGGITMSYRGIPYQQVANDSRTLALRANPDDGGALWWSYTASGATVFVEKPAVPGAPPRVRLQSDEPNGTWSYATPSAGFGHRYLSHTGNSQFPLDAWVTIAASNTVEGVQTLPVKGYWTINIKDATPGSPTNVGDYANDEVVATVPDVELNLPNTRWTPTGAGPVEFSIAQPGQLGIVQIESKGYDRTGYNMPLNVRPFGSVFVRAQTEAYGASNDCIPGAISVKDRSILTTQTRLFFLDAEPTGAGVTVGDQALGDPATPGQYPTQGGLQAAQGLRGRYAFDFKAVPAIATAPVAVPVAATPTPTPTPAATPAPNPAPKAVAFASRKTVKASKAGSVKLSLTNPNTKGTRYKLAVKTTGKHKVGGKRKVVNVAAGKTITVKPGSTTLRFSLSKAAKKLLKAKKSVKVKLTLTPTSGGSAVTKTITLKRS
jgi:hypothetical protein